MVGLACLLVLTGCRVDVTVDVTMSENGSGVLSVMVVADAEVVAAAPGLAEDVRTDDLAAAGWTTDGAVATSSGGLSLTIEHPFDTPEQATALLSTLNGPTGPLQAISIQRVATISEISYSITGTGRLDGGLDAFTDTELLATVGGTPFAEQIAASGTSPLDTVGIVLRLRMPGEVQTTTGLTASADSGGSGSRDRNRRPRPSPTRPMIRQGASTDASPEDLTSVDWTIALDGSDTVIEATSVKSLERGGGWSLLATALLVLLIAWVVVAVVAIALVARRNRRRHRSIRRLERGLSGVPYERVYHDDHTS